MIEPLAARVSVALDGADADALRDGAQWYADAQSYARQLSRESGLTVRTCAGIIAALSPRARWATNKAWARDVALAAASGSDCPTVSTRAFRAHAWRIAHGARPLRTLRGPKVRAFYRNICGDPNAVTVDVWAARAAGISALELARVGGYDAAANAYRAVARVRGLAASTVQAAVWIAVRGGAA